MAGTTFPHDIEARDFSSDGRTRLAMAEQLGLRPAVVVPRGDVADGIQAVRSLFPRLLFDSEKCYEGIEALKAYRREWNETRKTGLSTPCMTLSSQPPTPSAAFAMGYAEQPTLQLYTPGMPQTPPWARVPVGRGR